MKENELKKISLLSEVASMYYEKDMTQSQIAKRLFLSRTRISRLLKQAREEGLVEIKINYVLDRNYSLEARFMERFSLKNVIICSSNLRKPSDVKHEVGILASSYLNDRITKKLVLGVSWGTSVLETISALNPRKQIPIDVV
ncbi:MAG: MarR family transcriptional regulator, partial [Clostridiales bacterium]|nr:MarR family transcriptional regulator [Clostridiales bacterium]